MGLELTGRRPLVRIPSMANQVPIMVPIRLSISFRLPETGIR